MYRNSTVIITLIALNKTGVLSFLMSHGGKLGLLYKKSIKEVLSKDKLHLTVFYGGKFDFPEEKVIKMFEEHPSILKIEKISSIKTDTVEQKVALEKQYKSTAMSAAI